MTLIKYLRINKITKNFISKYTIKLLPHLSFFSTLYCIRFKVALEDGGLKFLIKNFFLLNFIKKHLM